MPATAALSMEQATAQMRLPVASAAANSRRIGRAAVVTPCALSHTAPTLLSLPFSASLAVSVTTATAVLGCGDRSDSPTPNSSYFSIGRIL